MREIVERTQNEYRSFRESVGFSIFDIESKLVQFAEEGRLWMIRGMNDLSDSETILISHYLSKKRELQNYDLVQFPAILQKSSQSQPSE